MKTFKPKLVFLLLALLLFNSCIVKSLFPFYTQDTIYFEKKFIGNWEEIEKGQFREDLYHRLAVILIEVPSLNDRREDIPLLIEYFSEKIANEQGTVKKTFSENAIKLLQAYDWTGNIRELRNVVERLIILGEPEISENDVKLFASKKI